jgi:hypothetical protein
LHQEPVGCERGFHCCLHQPGVTHANVSSSYVLYNL